VQQQQSSNIDVQARARELDEIAKSINNLADLFKDLSSLVIEQGTILDSIEYNIERTAVAMEGAVHELNVAKGCVLSLSAISLSRKRTLWYNSDPCLSTSQIPAECRSETMHLFTSCAYRGCHNHSHLQTKTTQLVTSLGFWYTSSCLRTGRPSERRRTGSGNLPTRVVRASSAVRLLSSVALYHRTVVSWHLNISRQRFPPSRSLGSFS
jgi:hypothetical protein